MKFVSSVRVGTQGMTDSIRSKHIDGVDFTPSTNRIHSGFLAQEVEQAEKDCGFTSTIVSPPSNATDPYSLNYGEFVVPLVKAVQELSKRQDSLISVIAALKGAGQRTNQNTSDGQGKAETISQIELANSAILFQNAPNPFGDGTTIKYFVPDNANAIIYFYDEFGNKLKEFKVEEKGMGQLNVSTMNLSAGFYSYSLLMNGKVVDTKKMIKN